MRLPPPDGNPKSVQGATKTPLHLIPPPAMEAEARAFLNGAVKYGPYNWREYPISASVYYAAALRHLLEWWERRDVDVDSGESPLAHVRACMAILLDADAQGTLNDDRPPNIRRGD